MSIYIIYACRAKRGKHIAFRRNQLEIPPEGRVFSQYIYIYIYIFKCISSLRRRDSTTSTELSKYIWKLKDEGVEEPEKMIKWEIVRRTVPYRCGTRKCDLCLSEKLVIATADPNTMLNTRSELVSKCRHRNKYNFKQERRRGRPPLRQ